MNRTHASIIHYEKNIEDLIGVYPHLQRKFKSTMELFKSYKGLIESETDIYSQLLLDNNMLKELEPWCSDMYGDWVGHKGFGVNKYIEEEQPNTKFNLSNKLHSHHTKPINDVVVRFDAQKLTPQNFQIIIKMSELLTDSGEVGNMEYDIFKFEIKSLNTYEKELIVCES